MNEDYIPAIITASVALLAAVGAQFLGHLFTNRRENRKNYLESYQKLIAPNLAEVILYYDVTTSFTRGHEHVKDVEIEKVVQNIGKQKHHGSVKMLDAFFELSILNHMYDFRGQSRGRIIVLLLFWYLDYARKIIKKISINDKKNISMNLLKTQKYYGISYLLFDISNEMTSVSNFMQYDFLFGDYVEKCINIKYLKKLINRSNENKRSEFLLKLIYIVENKQGWSEKENPFTEMKDQLKSIS